MAENIKTMGIVLNSSPHNIDGARRLLVFSPERGLFSAVIRGVEKPKAKLAVASSPFCFGEFVLAEKSGRFTVIDCAVQDTFFEIAYNLDAYVLASAMLEITSKIAQEGESNLELFKLLLTSLKVLVYEKAEPSVVLIKFMCECLNISGFGFDLKTCACCNKDMRVQVKVGLIYESSGVICSNCCSKMQNIALNQNEWKILSSINLCDMNNLGELNFDMREDLTSVLKMVVKQFYYRTNEKVNCLIKYFD